MNKMKKDNSKPCFMHGVIPRFEAKRIEPSSELLEFFRKEKEFEETFLFENGLYHKYNTVQDFLFDEIMNRIELMQSLGFSNQEIEDSFKGIDLINK